MDYLGITKVQYIYFVKADIIIICWYYGDIATHKSIESKSLLIN